MELDDGNLIVRCHGEGVCQLFVLGANEVEAGKLMIPRRSLRRSIFFR